MLTELFGTVSFHQPGGPRQHGPVAPRMTLALQTRSFTSFQQAATEAGMSRIYGGIHYSFDNTAGLSSGQQVGQLVMANLLQPKP